MLVNLTPHTINLVKPDGSTLVLPPSGTVARVATVPNPIGEHDGIVLFRVAYGPVIGLPKPSADRIFVVSALVRMAVPTRTDIASPGELVRNAEGQPVGCRGLIVN